MIKLDGWITIGTKLDTDKFDRQISDLENKIDSEEKKQELLNNKTQEYQQELSEATNKVKELTDEFNNATQKAEDLQNVIKNTKPGSYQNYMATAEFEEQSKIVEELYQKLSKAESKQAGLQNKVTQTNIQYENSVKAADRLRGKIETINFKRQTKEISQLTSGIGGAIKKVGKLALAVLSVRSAYSLLRQASSTWGQYNEQYAKDIEYIRFALAYGLAPILEKIVQLVATLMGYINYLSNAWFGKTIFASAKDFEKMSKSANGVAKSTKEIKNNLASFDELNILSKSAGGGAGSDFLMPSFDLGIEEVEIPAWIKWLGDNGEKVKKTLIGIGGAIGALKLSELATNLGLVAGKLSLIKGIGIGLAVEGITEGVKDLKKFMDDPVFENFGQTISDVGLAVAGFGIATGNLPVVAGGGLIWLTGKFVENWEEIKKTTQEGIDFLRTKSPEIEAVFGKTGAQIYNDVLDTSEDVLKTVDTTLNSSKNITYDFIGFIDALREGDWKTAWTKFKDIFVNIWDAIASISKTKINAILRFVNVFLEGVEKYINKLIDGINSVGGNISRINIGKIPLLGQQNVVSLPTRAELGLQGPMPQAQEETNGILSSIADKVSNVKQDISIRFEGTMSQLVRVLKPEIEVENNRTGSKIIQGGAY